MKETIIQEYSNQLVDVMTGEYKEEDYSPEKIGIKCEITTKEMLEVLLKDLKHRHLVRKDGDENIQRDYIKIAEGALNRLVELEKVLKIIKENCRFEFNERFVNNETYLYEVIINGFLSIQLSNKKDFDLLKEYLK